MNSRCARCNAPFHCGATDVEPCWCTGVNLDAATRAALSERYVGCLCAACLALAQAGKTPQTAQRDGPSSAIDSAGRG